MPKAFERDTGHLVLEAILNDVLFSNIDTTLNNFDTNHSVNNKVWDLLFGITLTADYNLENKWNLEYSKLLLNSNIYLTKKWIANNSIHLDLTTMNIDYYKVEFTRSLHCWDFSFYMKLVGSNKGFGLKINISEPTLQSIRMTQSTVPGSIW